MKEKGLGFLASLPFSLDSRHLGGELKEAVRPHRKRIGLCIKKGGASRGFFILAVVCWCLLEVISPKLCSLFIDSGFFNLVNLALQNHVNLLEFSISIPAIRKHLVSGLKRRGSPILHEI